MINLGKCGLHLHETGESVQASTLDKLLGPLCADCRNVIEAERHHWTVTILIYQGEHHAN